MHMHVHASKLLRDFADMKCSDNLLIISIKVHSCHWAPIISPPFYSSKKLVSQIRSYHRPCYKQKFTCECLIHPRVWVSVSSMAGTISNTMSKGYELWFVSISIKPRVGLKFVTWSCCLHDVDNILLKLQASSSWASGILILIERGPGPVQPQCTLPLISNLPFFFYLFKE